ncbi:hypothetical protein GCM10010172_19680 [Paractinoplanes ferrugineus]|uniref:IPT/TIG domain-containing protein n=1 Tax=Paractinoplanes ferrugineus TaxID=113564 RepID=A0A919J1Q3_9ACTN|nr:IPT/TIG domain-containing protein [Actinoplanes ferrugineus]GIE12089.1 hypothetical protein Afe05nite_39290 [Actinoplanes ferrugineus]
MPSFRLLAAGVAGAAAVLVAPAAALAAPVLGPVVVPVGGTATITDPAANYPSTVAVQLNTVACPAKIALATNTGPWIPAVTARTSTSVSFTVPTGPVTGTNGAVKAYNACVYDTAAGNSALQGSTTLYVGAPLAVSQASGPAGGGNQLTVTARPETPVFTTPASVTATFTTGSCGATFGTANPANLVATNVTKQSATAVGLTVPPGVVATGGGAPTAYTICLYDGSAATAALLSAAPYGANVATVNPPAGSYLANNAVSVSSSMPFLTGVPAPGVLLVTGAACPPAYSTTATGPAPVALTGTAVRRITSGRLLLNVPPLTLTGNQPTPYQVCVYANNAGGALVASATYTAALTATPTAVTPSAGPMSGGNTVTVLGTDFPTEPGRITATLGGVALTNIQLINDRAFTALAPAHPAEDDVTLIVTTPMGTRTLVGAYSYLNMIKAAPNTAPSSAGNVDVVLQGSKFLSIPFGAAGTAARIFLVDGVYNGADAGDGSRANGPVAECGDVLPITDEELVCTLQLGRRFNAAGTGYFDPATYANNVDDANVIAGSRLVTSGAGRFNRNDTGLPVTSPNQQLSPGLTISAVLSPTRALLSKPATVGGYLPLAIGGPLRGFGNALITTAGSATVSLMPGWTFTKADVGRVFGNTTGIANGTSILSIGPGGTTATLSAPATAGTTFTLTGVTATDGSTVITSAALTGNEAPAMIGTNSLGIPVGSSIMSVNPAGGGAVGSATISMPAVGGGTGSLTLSRQSNAMLFGATPVPNGSYHLTVVSNGAPDAALTDPDYFQTDVTSSSTFTVAPF